MLNSGCSVFGDVWDTNYACRFLKISDEQLRLLDSIPGWSKLHEEMTENQTSENVNHAPTTKNQLTLLQTSIPVNAANQSSTVIQNLNNGSNILVHSSVSPKKLSRITPSIDKENFMHSISLSFKKVVDVFSSLPRKRSKSVSDIHLLKVKESMSTSRSESNLMEISRNMCTEQFIPDKYSARKITFRSLRPFPSQDKTNNNQTAADTHDNKSREHLSEKKTFKKLGNNILNHPYLKQAVPIVNKSKGSDFLSIVEKKNLCREQLRKKLDLLKKRFSKSGKGVILSETQTGFSANLINDNKQMDSGTVINTSMNAITSSAHGVQSPEKTIQKQFTAADDEVVVKLIPNVTENKSCACLQGKLNPVVVHVSKSGTIPPSSDLHSSPQHNSINQSEMNFKDEESNTTVPFVVTLSTDKLSFAHDHLVDQTATVKPKDVDNCVPVLCRISSSSDQSTSAQLSLKSRPDMLSPMKSRHAGTCAPVTSGIPPSSGKHLSIQSSLTNPEIKSSIHCMSSPRKMSSSHSTALSHSPISKMESPMKSIHTNICAPVPSGILPPSDKHLSIQSNLLNHEIKSTIHCSTSPRKRSSSTALSPSPISKFGSPMKPKDTDTSVPLPSAIPSSDTNLSIQSNSTIHSTSSPRRMSSSQSSALSQSPTSKIRSPMKFKDPKSSIDLHTLTHSSVVNRPEAKSTNKDSMRVIETENEGVSFSVFSDNPSGWVVAKSTASCEVVKVSGKRKHKSKDDYKPHKKLPHSNSAVDIQYTTEQVQNMIEIMRLQFNM